MKLRVIHIARKPLAGKTVAKNVLEHGTGGINIDTSRVRYLNDSDKTPSVGRGAPGEKNPGCGSDLPGHKKNWGEWNVNHTGRWPTNLILQHKTGCQCEGTRKVRSSTPGFGESTPYGKGLTMGQADTPDNHRNRWHADADGKETVDNWACTEGCPVSDLDEQSGERPVSGCAKTGVRSLSTNDGNRTVYSKGLGQQGTLHNDTGGASRFFKQVK